MLFPVRFVAVLLCAVLSFSAFAVEAAETPYTWVFVDDMHCSNCAKKIARKLYTVSGVVKVHANVAKNYAVVTPQAGTQLSPLALWEAVEKANFKPVKLQGPSGVFTSKPSP